MTQWRNVGMPAMLERLKIRAPGTFERCKLDFGAGRNRGRFICRPDTAAAHGSGSQRMGRGRYDGAVFFPSAFLLRYFGPDGDIGCLW